MEDDQLNEDRNVSTLELFPDMRQFLSPEDEEEVEKDMELPSWAVVKLGTLQAKLEIMQNSRDVKNTYGTLEHSWNKFLSYAIINLANEIFGYCGWSSSIVDWYLIEENMDEQNSQFSVKYGARVRVELLDNIYSENDGVGVATKLPFKYMCISKAKKQAVTEATKNAIIGLREVLMNNESR